MRFLSHFFQQRRQATLPVRLSRSRIYILPSRAGLVFAFFLLAMLIAAINYTNNLAFLLTFLLGSMGLVSAVHAVRNLKGLVWEDVQLLPASSGEPLEARFFFQAPGQSRRSIEIRVNAASQVFSLEADQSQTCTLALPTQRRGLFYLDRVVLQTRYPLGLFRAWSSFDVRASGIVYPRPLPVDAAVWTRYAQELDAGFGKENPAGEFSGVRPYRAEDGLTRISWKASAKGAGLFAKEFQTAPAQTLIFDWRKTSAASYEERISRLAGLVRDAQRLDLHYGLHLPKQRLAVGCGAEHLRRCLEALALLPDQP